MNAFIDFIMGPMVWISFFIFIGGLGFRVAGFIREVKHKEPYIFSYMTVFHSLRSIGAWLIPFFPVSTRKKPFFYGISYLFHLLLFAVPIFLSAHVVLMQEAFNISWPVFDDHIADVLTVIVIVSLVFFGVRRTMVPDVRFLSSSTDFLLIALVLLPFLTGFFAFHQFFAYRWVMIVHILCGELMLIMIPFSRFSHMMFAPFTRAYTGSEFGSVRHARDW
ncbi:TmcC family electron transfer complex membrane anchor subunit [uncultured Desulfobacter sp.]|uniref:TmcC family electron transfer complex membrane anchor subunit n=1 Tax=uncultured Desulfobacter sp. TaxID=240139 RepID=UPI0029F52734|nr:nitrate reductase [uncultured Desulfobacter sp.]